MVMSIGAQKSRSGINSFPSDQLQPAEAAHRGAVSDAAHPVKTESAVSLLTMTGWQKSAVNNGLTSIVELVVSLLIAFHSQTASKLKHPA